MIIESTPEHFMREALKEAMLAFEADEVPIGAVVVHGNRIIGRGHNLTERLNDVTAHAEMQAFTAAANFVNGKYLTDCTLYVTIEPCVMCAGASYLTQISKIVYGARDEKKGFQNISSSILHPKTELVGGVMEEECQKVDAGFFSFEKVSSD
ncbi:MAG: nucleoside deaminase [Bacteroidetes bacterium]|nr:nucleoside deaminase [Bacteroidota bacterium]